LSTFSSLFKVGLPAAAAPLTWRHSGGTHFTTPGDCRFTTGFKHTGWKKAEATASGQKVMLQREEEEADPCAEALNNVQLAITRVSLKKAGSFFRRFTAQRFSPKTHQTNCRLENHLWVFKSTQFWSVHQNRNSCCESMRRNTNLGAGHPQSASCEGVLKDPNRTGRLWGRSRKSRWNGNQQDWRAGPLLWMKILIQSSPSRAFLVHCVPNGHSSWPPPSLPNLSTYLFT
jgi:hypothetical protein